MASRRYELWAIRSTVDLSGRCLFFITPRVFGPLSVQTRRIGNALAIPVSPVRASDLLGNGPEPSAMRVLFAPRGVRH